MILVDELCSNPQVIRHNLPHFLSVEVLVFLEGHNGGPYQSSQLTKIDDDAQKELVIKCKLLVSISFLSNVS